VEFITPALCDWSTDRFTFGFGIR